MDALRQKAVDLQQACGYYLNKTLQDSTIVHSFSPTQVRALALIHTHAKQLLTLQRNCDLKHTLETIAATPWLQAFVPTTVNRFEDKFLRDYNQAKRYILQSCKMNAIPTHRLHRATQTTLRAYDKWAISLVDQHKRLETTLTALKRVCDRLNPIKERLWDRWPRDVLATSRSSLDDAETKQPTVKTTRKPMLASQKGIDPSPVTAKLVHAKKQLSSSSHQC